MKQRTLFSKSSLLVLQIETVENIRLLVDLYPIFLHSLFSVVLTKRIPLIGSMYMENLENNIGC